MSKQGNYPKISVCVRCGRIAGGDNLCDAYKRDLEVNQTTDRDHYRTGKTTSETDRLHPTF